MQIISSKDNAKLKGVRALLRSKKEREKLGCFVLEGVRALSPLNGDAALPQYKLKEVWMSDKADAAVSLPFVDFGVSRFQIPHEWMEQLSDCRTSQGFLGVVEVAPVLFVIQPDRGRYLLLDRVMDPGNMGTLIRSAVAFGFDGVLLHGDCVEVFNPKTVRATMGALPFCCVHTLNEDWFSALTSAGYELFSTVLRGGENLYEMKFGLKTVLVIGNEAQGVSSEIQRRTSWALSIPMTGQVESLNAAVAGSVCMSAMHAADVDR